MRTQQRLSTTSLPPAVAELVGLDEEARPPGVEANARLTATTGILLFFLLFFEGITVVAIGPLLPWHIGIGLALIPPVALKLGSTGWRFVRYYLRDRRYRAVGPPHPLLRVLGPLVVVSTAALLGSGVALWLAGPQAGSLRALHKATFVVWLILMGVHVLAHLLRATRLTASDALRLRPVVRGAWLRQGLVVASLVLGAVLGFATRNLVHLWAGFGTSHFIR